MLLRLFTVPPPLHNGEIHHSINKNRTVYRCSKCCRLHSCDWVWSTYFLLYSGISKCIHTSFLMANKEYKQWPKYEKVRSTGPLHCRDGSYTSGTQPQTNLECSNQEDPPVENFDHHMLQLHKQLGCQEVPDLVTQQCIVSTNSYQPQCFILHNIIHLLNEITRSIDCTWCHILEIWSGASDKTYKNL